MTKTLRRYLFFVLVALFLACGSGASESPGGQASDLLIQKIAPTTLVPGSTLAVQGNFVDLMPAFLELDGTFEGVPANVLLPAALKGIGRLEVSWKGGQAMGFAGNDGTFSGTVRVKASIPADPREHVSEPLPITLKIASKLEPQIFGLVYDVVSQVNSTINVEGKDFLLGGAEGSTVAILEGCFTKQGDTSCTPVKDIAVPLIAPLETTPDTERRIASFPFIPAIAGIQPGAFDGTVRLRNEHAQGSPSAETNQVPMQIQLVAPTLVGFSPPAASLGQYVQIAGGGFLGKWKHIDDSTTQATRIQLTGTFTPTGAPMGAPVDLELITEFVDGKSVRYVLNEDDALGQTADLRTITGQFKGNAKPITTYGNQTVSGAEIQVTLGIAPVKQVVWVSYLPTYKNSLEHFGLRAADQRIRDRVLEVMRFAYIGVNIEFRPDEPSDFKLYTTVELEGPDPNGLGLLGYDNSPGKDKGNVRLTDKIGGVNALTQEGGYPGYGGVFVDSLLAFSAHPPKFVEKLDDIDPVFDQIFDPFRTDRGGSPVLAEELASNVPVLQNGLECPAPKSNRKLRIACAIWVLGGMIGTTTAHEVGHSLGLADPDGEEFHNPGDEKNRIMDSGGARTFRERAELGEGPGAFCDDEFKYLRTILPSNVPDPLPGRPGCY